MNERDFPRLVVSATHKSAGKTTVAAGLLAALSSRGLKAQPFKKGPDFIDPMWLSAASGLQCRNLDNFMFGWDKLEALFRRVALSADVSIIEGNKGLHDSADVEGEGSVANLARRLKAPVVMVLDASGTTRGIAPLLLGYKAFEPDVNIAGVILNKVGSARHESKLRAVIEKYCGVEILGSIRRTDEMEILERHLGLVPIKEDESLSSMLDSLRRHVSYALDLDRVLAIASSAPPMEAEPPSPPTKAAPRRVRLGVVMDRAFTFYYPENLEALEAAGAELVKVDAITTKRLPDGLDALYIGGGFPEMFMAQLEANEGLKDGIRLAVEDGMPVHGECGGLIYLSKSVSHKGRRAAMIGALDCDVVIREKPKGHGYMVVEPTGKSPWMNNAAQIRAHEFHYGEVVNLRHAEFAFRVARGTGINGRDDGIVYKNVTASFAHLHHLACPYWAADFVAFAERTAFGKSAGRKGPPVLAAIK
ncbi:MAG: hydrogenobyrinic acid a,c-diamide synthase (glutamine-hydrolyzing) [Nitrospinae bacterium]|nr:hydrogenobyrinic acid a,c-diamide synthase (glutamine-hydrolyzing) [Nitrospinota bacterium]